ncbi:MAG: VOC family protein [Cellvibrionaceae bacterium]
MHLEHINIRVPSIEKTQRFLQAAFPDFRVRGSGPNTTYGYWAHIGNDETYIAMSQSQKPGNELDIQISEYHYDDPFRLMHIGYVVSDIDAVRQRLNDSGYTPVDLDDLSSHPYRKRVYYFDENGIEWEFIQYLSEKNEEKNDYCL